MKLLHTSDWHIGKTLRGRSRLPEQEMVLRELVQMARDHDVDAVVIAGDLYDTSAPSAEAIDKVVKALIGFRATGAEVIVIAGNHDHAPTFEAYRPLMSLGGIHVAGTPRTAADGGVITFTARTTGEKTTVAVLPFLSQRYASRAAEIITGTPAETGARYDEMVRAVLASLAAGFQDDAVNLVVAHLTVTGATFGGGEREAQSIFDYHVSPAAFPAQAHYVALGHLHRRQHVAAPCPAVHYCGSPINVDFGEQDNGSFALFVEAAPHTPARITELPVRSAVKLRTVQGSVADLLARAGEFGEDLLRVVVAEPSRATLRDEILAGLPNAIDIRIDPEFQKATAGARTPSEAGLDRSPMDLFTDFLANEAIVDPRLPALFSALLDRTADPDPTAGVTDDIPLPNYVPQEDAPSPQEADGDGLGADADPHAQQGEITTDDLAQMTKS
jgi:DNA repair protein SbcD/Mre11